MVPPQQPPAQPEYVPLPSFPNDSPAYMQSLQATNIAAGKDPAEFGVKAPDAPAEFPLAMYNRRGETKTAADARNELQLAAQGYTRDPMVAHYDAGQQTGQIGAGYQQAQSGGLYQSGYPYTPSPTGD